MEVNWLNVLEDMVSKKKYADAYKLGLTLWEEEKNDTKNRLRIASVLAVCVIESGNRGEAEKAIARFNIVAGKNTYSKYLIANLQLLQEKHTVALHGLEKAIGAYWVQKQLHINKKAIDNTAPAVMERILNSLGRLYKFYGYTDKACICYKIAAEFVPDLKYKLHEYSNYLFACHYNFMSSQEYFMAHTGYEALIESLGIKSREIKPYAGHEKIRIGYLSPDFKRHVVLLFIWAMLTQYDNNSFEVYCYSLTPENKEDKYSEYIKAKVSGWECVEKMQPAEAAELIASQEIDILVELAGHTSHNGLAIMAYKPAPVQVCGIGYFATTGLKSVDYFLSDRYIVGIYDRSDDLLVGESEVFTEKLLILPNSHFCYVPLNEVPDVQGAPCKKNGYITFGSFNNLTKVNDKVLEVWAQILLQVPESKLYLKSSQLDDDEARRNIVKKLNTLGIAIERLILEGFSRDYLPEYYRMDIALDTFPYPGGGTTCDALYMGVPVVTLGDGSHGGNFGVSLLSNVGLSECCAFSIEEYISKAVMIASDFELVDTLHLGLRNMVEKSPLMDSKAYMRDLENAYRNIYISS